MTFVIAHRGSRPKARENTIPAFEAARESGRPRRRIGRPPDRRRHLVVHHDPEIPDVGRIEDLGAGRPAGLGAEPHGGARGLRRHGRHRRGEGRGGRAARRPRSWSPIAQGHGCHRSIRSCSRRSCSRGDRSALLWPAWTHRCWVAASSGAAPIHTTRVPWSMAASLGMRLAWTVNSPHHAGGRTLGSLRHDRRRHDGRAACALDTWTRSTERRPTGPLRGLARFVGTSTLVMTDQPFPEGQ